MATRDEASQPRDLNSLILREDVGLRSTPTPTTWQQPGQNAALRTTLPPLAVYQPDQLRQFYIGSVNQQRISPLPPAGSPTQNAAVQSISTTVVQSAPVSSVPFNQITTGNNTIATMTLDSGSTLTFVGTGNVNARKINNIDVSGNLPAHAGQLLISQPGNTTAVWADPLVQGLYPDGANIAVPPPQVTPTVINPVYVGGKGADGNLHGLSTDNSGNLNVTVSGGGGATNVTQFGGNNIVTGTGASGVGIPRVTVSNDSSVLVGRFDTILPTLVSGNAAAIELDVNGRIILGPSTAVIGGLVANQSVSLTQVGNVTLTGDNTANFAAKVPVLPARANAASPSWTEGNQVPLSTDLSGNLRVTTVPGSSSSTFRTDTFTAAGNGVTTDLSANPLTKFSIQVKGTGNQALAWDVRLEGSLDNVTFTTILQHTNTLADGATVFNGAGLAPARFFRSRVASLTLGLASNVVVSILGVQ